MSETAGEARTNLQVTFLNEHLLMDAPVMANSTNLFIKELRGH